MGAERSGLMHSDQWFLLFVAGLFLLAMVGNAWRKVRAHHRIYLQRVADIDAEFTARELAEERLPPPAKCPEVSELQCSCSSCKFYNALHNQE